ncbi:MAG: response regulator [Rhizomicrobium sp.]
MQPEPTVFVVDDHDRVRGSIRALLESAGLKVEDFPSALEFLDRARPQPSDCVVADVRMPQMSGLELQEELSRRGIRVAVIIVTGHADVPLAVKALKAGAADLIEKPFDDEALLGAVSRALENGRQAQEQATSAREAEALIALLTEREQEIFHQLATGRSNKLVAHALGISPRTVEVHRSRIQDKMRIASLADLVRIARAAESAQPALRK